MSLRIAWATPWNERSSIAKDFSAGIVRELMERGHEVRILRTETGDAKRFPAIGLPVQVDFWDSVNAYALGDTSDVVAVNFGDYYPFHGAVLPEFAGAGVVGIFHDFFLSGLISEWAKEGRFTESFLPQLIETTYGAEEWQRNKSFWLDTESMAKRRPLTEWLAGNVIACVAHARHYVGRLEGECPGPVKEIPLCELYDHLPPVQGRPDGQMTIATIGHQNRNKLADRVIAVIGKDGRLRKTYRYKLIGPIDKVYKAELERLASGYGVSLECTGWVSDEDLRRHLAGVHVMACLRNPVLEGASGSLLLALQSGRPTLVSDHGVYAEIPDDMVFACTPGDEERDVREHLGHIMDDYTGSIGTGARAQAFSRAFHAPKRYVDELIPFLHEAISARPAIMTARSVGNVLSTFGLDIKNPAIERVGKIMDDFLGRG